MPKKIITIFLLIMTMIFLFLNYFTSFSQNQIYLLKNYQSAYTDYTEGNYQVIDEVYSFENSIMTLSFKDVAHENGIYLGEKDFTIYNNQVGVTQNYADFEIIDVETLFTNYLVNYYSLYGSIIILGLILLKALGIIVVTLCLLYVVKRIIVHVKKRDEIYIKNQKFISDSYLIAVILFTTVFIYSYLSLFLGIKIVDTNIYIVTVLIYLICLLKGKREI